MQIALKYIEIMWNLSDILFAMFWSLGHATIQYKQVRLQFAVLNS